MENWMLKLQLAAPILGSLLGLMMMKQVMKKHHIPYEKLLDMLTNALLIILFTWKFAPAILNPSWAIASPMAALLTAGSMKHVIIGCLIAVSYIVWKWKKESFLFSVLLDILPFGISSTLIVYYILNPLYGFQTELPWGMHVYDSKFAYHPIHLYEILIATFLLAWLWVQKEKLGSKKYIRYFLIGEGSARIFLSFFIEQYPYLFGVSFSQLLGFVMISVGILMNQKNLSREM